MKKIAILLICLFSIFSFAACGGGKETEEFQKLELGQTLFVGNNNMFKNYIDAEATKEYLSYEKSVTYTLNRTNFNGGTSYVPYNGYYYYWSSPTTITDQELLGIKTIYTSYKYSYLPYGQNNENIVVKTTITVETNFDFVGGFITKERECITKLNNYFESIDDMKAKCPDLLAKIDLEESKQYYVDTTLPAISSSSRQTFTSTYFYFE